MIPTAKGVSFERDQLATDNSVSSGFEMLPKETIAAICENLPIADLGSIASVCERFKAISFMAAIDRLRGEKIALKHFFRPDVGAKRALDWIESRANFGVLTYCDFSDFKDFDNDCFAKLADLAPKISTLSIKNCSVRGAALALLNKMPALISLSIADTNLERDALKQLEHCRRLRKIDLSNCYKLEKDSLKNLKYTPLLESLNIRGTEFEGDALQHLVYTPKLKKLNLAFCRQLLPDSLKHLSHTPQLELLNMRNCNQLKREEYAMLLKGLKVFIQ